MQETTLSLPNNLAHNVLGPREGSQTTLLGLANLYLETEVDKGAKATFDAKQRDLQRFLTYYHALYGHDRPEAWFVSVSKGFIKHLNRDALAQASVARIYATVRHFARWLHRKFDLFPLGCPTDGVKPPRESEPDWKGLTRTEELRLLSAAQTLRVRPGRGTNQGLRDHALLATLLGSGLRISEALALSRTQYTGKGFSKIIVKGGHGRDFVPLHQGARQVIEAWLVKRGETKGPLFCTRSGEPIGRRQASTIIQRIARQASASLPEDEHITVSPHMLRHTFLRKLAETKGVQYAKEASGHQSDRYIWRYVKPDRQSLAEAIDALD